MERLVGTQRWPVCTTIGRPEGVEVGTTADLEQGYRQLEVLAKAEYGLTLDDLLADSSRSQDERFWRIGRLIGISVKEPFAQPVDIAPRSSQTGARRRWDLDLDPFDTSLEMHWQYGLLQGLAADRDLRRTMGLGPSPAWAAELLGREWDPEAPTVDRLAAQVTQLLHVDRESAEAAATVIVARSVGAPPSSDELESWLWDELSDELQSPWHVQVVLGEMHSERGLFRCLALSARKYLCGNAELTAKLDQSLAAAGQGRDHCLQRA